MSPALGTDSREAELPGSVWHEGRRALKGLGSELRILSPSSKGLFAPPHP